MATTKTTEKKSAPKAKPAASKTKSAAASKSGSSSKSASSKAEEPKKTAATSTAGKSSGAKASASKSASSKSTTAKAKAAPKSQAKPKGESVKRFDGKSTTAPMALAFLMKQHREVEGYFDKFEKARSDEEKGELAGKICSALKVHAQIEEELLYPEAHEKLEDEDMVDEAYVEHASAKDLIAQIEAMRPGEHLYDAKVKVLGEYIKHHVQEEEQELFPEIQKSEIDLEGIGPRLQARSEELMAQMQSGGSSRGGLMDRLAETVAPRG